LSLILSAQEITQEIEKEFNTMPKMKTHKGTAKRFKVTAKGKLRRLKHRHSHKRTKKSKRVRRSMDKDHPVSPVDAKRLRRLLGLPQKEK
jgi:large subunit ribosomal protein L35